MAPGTTAAPAASARRFGVTDDASDAEEGEPVLVAVVPDGADATTRASDARRSSAPAADAMSNTNADALVEYRWTKPTISDRRSLDSGARECARITGDRGSVSGDEVLEGTLENAGESGPHGAA